MCQIPSHTPSKGFSLADRPTNFRTGGIRSVSFAQYNQPVGNVQSMRRVWFSVDCECHGPTQTRHSRVSEEHFPEPIEGASHPARLNDARRGEQWYFKTALAEVEFKQSLPVTCIGQNDCMSPSCSHIVRYWRRLYFVARTLPRGQGIVCSR